jgi:hypothetical protein
LFWNVTLRSHTTAISTIETAKQSEESDFVFSEGLVALSLNGNNITDNGVKYLRSAVHSNHWFLGEGHVEHVLEFVICVIVSFIFVFLDITFVL